MDRVDPCSNNVSHMTTGHEFPPFRLWTLVCVTVSPALLLWIPSVDLQTSESKMRSWRDLLETWPVIKDILHSIVSFWEMK